MCFSSKLCFEEKHNVEHLVMKLFDKETSSCLLVITGHFDTFIDETQKEP